MHHEYTPSQTLKTLAQIQKLLLLFLMLVSKTMSLLQFYISTLVKIFLPKQFIMLSTSPLLRQSCLQSDTALIKQFMSKMLLISLLLLILFTLQGESLICPPTLTNCSLSQYYKTLENSSIKDIITPLNSGIALVVPNEFISQLLIKRPRRLTIFLISHVSHHGILAKKKSVIKAFKTVRYLSKHHITKEKISLIFLVMTIFFTKLIYIKDSAWLKLFRHSNSLYVRATRAINNHALIGEYCLRFFSRELFKYSCGLYPIELR